jgi:hypothetical protein
MATRISRKLRNRVGALAAVLVVTLMPAGCGGDDEDSAESWANDVCSSMSAWLSDVDEAVASLTEDGLSTEEDDLRSAVDRIVNATDELGDELRDLGPPETEGGGEAETELEGLATALSSEAQSVRQVVESDGEALSVTSTVTMSVSTAASEVQSTLRELDRLDPGGELEEGFDNADECDSLRDQIEDLGS